MAEPKPHHSDYEDEVDPTRARLDLLSAYTMLGRAFPRSPFVEPARITLAEAQVEAGQAAVARPGLEEFVTASPADPRAPRAWLALARAREATGDRAGAGEAYAHAAKDPSVIASRPEASLGYARLLTQEKRWSEARDVLERLVRSDDKNAVAAAAVGIGETYQGEGDFLAAAEYFMTAAYVAPDTPAGRRGLLGAGASFTALKQVDAAATVCRKLLNQGGIPTEQAEAARKCLKDVGR